MKYTTKDKFWVRTKTSWERKIENVKWGEKWPKWPHSLRKRLMAFQRKKWPLFTPKLWSTLPATEHNQKGWVCNPNGLVKLGKTDPGWAIRFRNVLWGSHGKKWPLQFPNSWIYSPLTVQHPKMVFLSRVMRKTTTKTTRRDPSHWMLTK